MKKFFILIFCLFTLNANALDKETTFDKQLFDKAQSEGKVVIVSSWIKYCSSCAGQMKILKTAKKEGGLSDIKFDNIEYFAFDVTNKEIANLLKVQFQTTLLIFKDNYVKTFLNQASRLFLSIYQFQMKILKIS